MIAKNTPGEPITTREVGAHFYCLSCFKEYRKCKCKVYISADTLPKVANPIGFGARNGQDDGH